MNHEKQHVVWPGAAPKLADVVRVAPFPRGPNRGVDGHIALPGWTHMKNDWASEQWSKGVPTECWQRGSTCVISSIQTDDGGKRWFHVSVSRAPRGYGMKSRPPQEDDVFAALYAFGMLPSRELPREWSMLARHFVKPMNG